MDKSILKSNRQKVLCQNLRDRWKEERIAKYALIASFAYAFFSNIFLLCPSLPLHPCILNFMASIDEVLRNGSYGVIASVVFYLFHDLISKNSAEVDLYNGMFEELHKLWWNVREYMKIISKDAFDETQDASGNAKCIYSKLCCNEKIATFSSTTDVGINDFHYLQITWNEIQCEKRKFLETYANVISREEFMKLNLREYDISVDRLSNAMPEVEQFEKGMTVTVRDYDIQRAAYLITEFYTDLSKMVVKYHKYDYSETKDRKKLPQMV